MVLDIDVSGGMSRTLSVVVGAVVVLVILAALTPVFFDAVADLVNNLTADNVTTGNDAADQILEAFAPVIGILAAIVFLGLVIRGIQQRR